MISTDGDTYVSITTGDTSDRYGIAWGPEANMVCAVSLGVSHVITSSGNNLKCTNLAIGDSVTGNDASAILDITSTTKGFLPPRMNTTQRDIINPAAQGLTIYNTTTDEANIYNGSAWVGISTTAHGSYTIDVTGTANTAATGDGTAYFMRVGDVVKVSCNFTVDPTAINTLTTATMSLPFTRSAGNFSSVNQGFGIGTTAASTGNVNYAHITSTSGAATMTVSFVSDGTAANKTWYCTFQYSQINT
jgi:hypothetical protein